MCIGARVDTARHHRAGGKKRDGDESSFAPAATSSERKREHVIYGNILLTADEKSDESARCHR